MKNMLQLCVFLVLTNCTMKPQETKVDHSQFQELQIHKGSENYEIVEIFDKKFEVKKAELDIHNEKLVIYGKTNPVDKDKFLSDRVKISILGDITDKGITNARIEKDGSMHGFDFYSNWIVDGDTTKYKYIDPFSKKEIIDPYELKPEEENSERWMAKFKELYSNAQYVFTDISFYYFKIIDKWYLMEAELEGLPENLEEQYPPKEQQNARMLELENLAPLWYHKGFEERDTSLIKMIDYESTFYTEENFGLIKQGYSAGWWYLEVYMPLGDTLRIKRYSYFEDPDLKLYKIPAAYGGRNDVLFIVQKPKSSHAEQVAGMYAIRPRDPEQPERRYSSISYGDTAKGQPHILRAEESREYKKWKGKIDRVH